MSWVSLGAVIEHLGSKSTFTNNGGVYSYKLLSLLLLLKPSLEPFLGWDHTLLFRTLFGCETLVVGYLAPSLM
jgi:hypothetical protein